jgi:ribonuclease J
MQLTIHRGTKEIGGSCVEIGTDKARIVIDIGFPLKGEDGKNFSNKKNQDLPIRDLVEKKILHNVEGLFKDTERSIDAILISHPHQDHYGFLQYINPEIPVYTSFGCRELINLSFDFFMNQKPAFKYKLIKAWETFDIKDIRITPYLVDHSGFDAMAFLIEAEGKRLFYSGDFRGHGRKDILFKTIIKEPPRDIDYLILEGTMIGRSNEKYKKETDIEKELIDIFNNNDKLIVFACSSQNIDRLVSFYRACIKTGKILVLDPYTTFILDKIKDIAHNVPQFDWEKHFRIYNTRNRFTKKMAENKTLYKYKNAKITIEEIVDKKGKIVIKDSFKNRDILKSKNLLNGAILIYSMWEGYYERDKTFWEEQNVTVKKVHTSGHAFVSDLQKFVKAINPKHIIPIHTEYKDKYEALYHKDIIQLKDGEVFSL